MTRYPFPMRLVAAQRMLVHRTAPTGEHLADQMDAASGEMESMAQRIGMLLPILSPERSWFHREDTKPSELVRADILAAVLGCTEVCPHLRRGGPQPAIVRLSLRRIDCQRCVKTLRRPPADEADQCDLCQQPEVLTFVPFAVRHGPALIAGDVCLDCAGVLGIRRESAA